MGREDWYRRTSWAEAERGFFEEKLRRARRASRAGYLRVQGTLLTESSDESVRAAGRELLFRAIEDHADDNPLEGNWARANLARALAREGLLEDAERWYRECAHHQEAGGYGLNTDCHLGLAEVLLRRASADATAVEQAAAALDMASELNPPLFHADAWRFSAALARLAAARGDAERAREWATRALEVADIDEPQVPRHPNVGLARPHAEDLAEMRRLARG
jgi:hypothetical protein